MGRRPAEPGQKVGLTVGGSAKRVAARSLVICGGLARAVRRESGVAVCHWWGVTPQTVTKWRKALGVGPVTAGTRRIRQEQWRRVYTPELVARTVAGMNTQETNAKKARAWLGKPQTDHAHAATAGQRAAQVGRSVQTYSSGEPRYHPHSA